jgi:hypothetical protein
MATSKNASVGLPDLPGHMRDFSVTVRPSQGPKYSISRKTREIWQPYASVTNMTITVRLTVALSVSKFGQKKLRIQTCLTSSKFHAPILLLDLKCTSTRYSQTQFRKLQMFNH